MNRYLSISPEVQQALDEGRPVVALESTIISHGMPYPQNVETALRVEQTIRDGGAVPATIAIIGGKLKAGCRDDSGAGREKRNRLRAGRCGCGDKHNNHASSGGCRYTDCGPACGADELFSAHPVRNLS